MLQRRVHEWSKGRPLWQRDGVRRLAADALATCSDGSSVHPDRRFLLVMCVAFAEYAAGRLPGPFTDALAERFARAVLLDPAVLAAHAEEGDRALAARLSVPENQVALAREEIRRG